MFGKRTLQIAVVMLLVGWQMVLASGAGLSFETPTWRDVPLGSTRIALNVTTSLDMVEVYANGLLIGTAKPPHWEFVADIPGTFLGAEYVAVGFLDGVPKAEARVATRKVRISEEVDVIRVQLFPVVRSINGSFVSDLQREDFEVLENGIPVPLRSFEQRARNLSIAILLDVSESMRITLPTLQQAACEFTDTLGEEDQISVLCFNEDLMPIVPMSTDRELIKRGIRSMDAEGATALYDSIIRVIESFDGVDGRKVLLVFSDGRDLASISSVERVVRQARESEVIIYTIGPSKGENLRDLKLVLDYLAGETGGQSYLVQNPASFARVFKKVSQHLRAQYELTFLPAPGPSGMRKIKVRIKRPGLRAHTRQTYFHRNPQERGQ